MSKSETGLVNFLSPRYWITWISLGLLRLTLLLPFGLIESIGSAFGLFMYYAMPARTRVAKTNLRIAFPEKNESEINQLCRTNFKQLGLAIFEIGMAWWQQDRLLKMSRINGLEHVEKAFKDGKGVILLTSHFTCLESGAHIICTRLPLEAVYKPAKNKLFEHFMAKSRRQHFSKLISNDNPRQMIAALKRNHAIWYAPDQNMRSKDVIFTPFFNEMATTLTAPARLAKMSNAAVIPYYIKRHRDTDTGKPVYELFILPAVTDFPTNDADADAAYVNNVTEQLIRKNPEQYLWVHKRYRTRPPGAKALY